MDTYRNTWMDMARMVVIILVVLTHAIERAGSDTLAYSSLSYSIDRTGVPIFLMISGALMIPKAYQLGIWGFYKRYFCRIVPFVFLFFTMFSSD